MKLDETPCVPVDEAGGLKWIEVIRDISFTPIEDEHGLKPAELFANLDKYVQNKALKEKAK